LKASGSIFLCSWGTEEGRDPSLEEKKTGESNPLPSAVRVNIASYYRAGGGRAVRIFLVHVNNSFLQPCHLKLKWNLFYTADQ